MLADGERVTVRAVWPMPGAPVGAGATVVWGPHLAALVDAGRYEVLPPAADEGDEPAVDVPATSGSDGGGSDRGVGGPAPRRGRGR